MLIILTAIGCVLSYLLYDDSLLFPVNKVQSLEQIGQVSITVKDVRKKSLTNFMWLPSTQQDVVYQGDSIFTGDDSEASVQLADGTVVEVKSNSLVAFNLKDSQMALNLEFGNFVGKLTAKTKLAVRTGREVIQLNGDRSKVELKKPQSGQMNVKVIEGSVEIKSEKINKTLAQNEVIKIDKIGVEKTLADAWVKLTSPGDNVYVVIGQHQNHTHKWDGHPDIPLYRLVYSTDSDFKQEQTWIEGKVTTFQPKEYPSQGGKIYWRVYALDEEKKIVATSATQSIDYLAPKAPAITSHGTENTFAIKVNYDGQRISADKIKITYTHSEAVKFYEWQWAKNMEFEKPLVSQSQWNKTEVLTPSVVPNSEYSFRIRATDSKGLVTPWSPVVKFKVISEGPKSLFAAPLIAQEAITYSPRSDRKLANEDGPQLSWSKVPGAGSYLLQISKTADFNNATDVNLTSETTTWTGYDLGTFYYRVFALTPKGQKSPASKVGNIKITVSKPSISVLGSVKIDAKTSGEKALPKSVRLEWTQVPMADSYVIQMASDASFSKPKSFKSRAPASDLSLPQPGLYHVRVQPLDKDGQPLTEYSEARQAEYQMNWPMGAPRLIDPLDKMTVFLQADTAPFIWLYWEQVPAAQYYTVEISEDPLFQRPLISQRVDSNKFLIKQKVPTGNIYWHVRAETGETISEWSKPRSFIIYSSGE